MKKVITAFTVALALVTAFAFTAVAADFTLKFANPVSKGHSWGRAAEYMAKEVAAATKGRVEIKVFHSSSLGKIREVLEMVKMGTVDFVLSGTGHVTGLVPEMGITVLPYLWKDTDTMFEALDGPFGSYLNAKLNQKGYEVVGWWDNGFRHVSNNRGPINKPADIKGLKIRCLPAKVHVAFFKGLGASPTPMGWSELYQGLQQGVVDAQENPPAMVYLGKLHEVQKYYSLTGHVNEPGNVLMSSAALKKLPADLQLALKVAAQKASQWQRAESAKDNIQVMDKLKAAGMKINKVPAETISNFRSIAQGVYPKVAKSFGPDGAKLVDLMVFFNK